MRADVPMGMARALEVPKDRCVQQQWRLKEQHPAPPRPAAPQPRPNLRNPPGEFTHFPNVRVLQFCKCAGFAILQAKMCGFCNFPKAKVMSATLRVAANTRGTRKLIDGCAQVRSMHGESITKRSRREYSSEIWSICCLSSRVNVYKLPSCKDGRPSRSQTHTNT